MTAIEQCRTAALGGHVEQCDRCSHRRVWYNSCRNRHCPTCQSLARAAWLARRRADLLPTEYFHVVFTVPRPVAAIAAQNKAVVYRLLVILASTFANRALCSLRPQPSTSPSTAIAMVAIPIQCPAVKALAFFAFCAGASGIRCRSMVSGFRSSVAPAG